MYDYMLNKCGLVHITIGDGGNQEGLSGLNYLANSNGADPLAHRAPPLYSPQEQGIDPMSSTPCLLHSYGKQPSPRSHAGSCALYYGKKVQQEMFSIA